MKPPFWSNTSVYQTMLQIVHGAPPTLDEPTHASLSFVDFVASALVKDPAARPAASTLLQHPFLSTSAPSALRDVVQAQIAQREVAGWGKLVTRRSV